MDDAEPYYRPDLALVHHLVHDNVLIDASRVLALLAALGVEATVGSSVGIESQPRGLRTIIGRRTG